MITPPALSSFGAWAAQIAGRVDLQAETTTEVPARGDGRQLFVYVRLGKELDAAVERLRESGATLVTFTLRDKFDVGEEFFRWQFAVAVAGSILGVNPFRPPAHH